MNTISKVVPAILTDDPKTLETLIRQAESFTNYMQLDIMDGKFVPSKSISHDALANIDIKLNWEVHLMVEKPETYLKDFRQAGAQKVVFHYESTSSPQDVISEIKSLGMGVGLAINPETSISAIHSLISAVDSILLLAVNPGFYGSQFIPEVLDKVAEIRSISPDSEIGMDGGMKENNVSQVARIGVDVIYVGSAIFLQPQPGESFKRLQSLAEEGSRQRSQ